MTTPAEFVAMAGAATTGALGTESVKYVRDRVLGLFRSHAPEEAEAVLERLDGYDETLAAAPGPVREHLARAAEEDITAALGTLAARSDEAAAAVCELGRELREMPAGAPASRTVTFQHISTGGGDFFAAGHDNNATKGDK
ncbi:hypothetical protein [Streptomyces sp. NPDC048172]|uniref:hypothetical protein n=1 Tax=Streptomyces sp. NPDC048172 TaxID=3365505 RepID=UPI00371ABB0E